MDSKNKLEACSMDFAVNILRVSEQCKGHYTLVNQLERSATSIGANIREARYAHGRADFIAKLQIALKETAETEYWLRLLVLSDYLSQQEGNSFIQDCLEIKRIMISSMNTAKK